jgi:hypothetical protein
MRAPGTFFALVLAAAAQAPPGEKPLLEYTGTPLTVSFRCTEEDMHWAGMSCSEEEPCPVYLELTAVESVGNKIFAVGNIHSAAVTLHSILLASGDAGKTWREAHDRIRGAGLDQIQFIDFETGWISGQALSPLPQDAFLLITSDGGETWRKRDLFSETRIGSIQQFWFTSKSNGSLILDRGQGGEGGRYEVYESPNAGESWMLRETSEKPPKSRRAPPPAAWRIHADAATKSFRIERQAQADRWAPAAAFAIPVGVCRPEPRKEPEEPPLPEILPEQPAAPTPARPKTQPSLKRPPR